VPITAGTTAQELHDQLATRGATDLLQVIDLIGTGTPPRPLKQDENKATYAEKLRKEEAEIDWNLPAEQVLRKIKAFNPWPVAYTRFNGKSLRIWDAGMASTNSVCEPGTLLSVDQGLPVVSCGDGAICLLEVQPEGKKRMSSQAFMNARKEDVRRGIVMGQ
jgi:methionyl-tRNA formyltransferase